MSKKQETSKSRRKFVKIAVTTAYVAPLVVSMPAKANFIYTGSGHTQCDSDVPCDIT